MNRNTVLIGMSTLLIVGLISYWFGYQTAPKTNSVNDAASASSQKILYWYDPMVPQQHFDKPGKSPFMDMDLVPKYADEDHTEQAGTVTINPQMVANLGIRTARAELGILPRQLETLGYMEINENQIESVQTRVAGWIEHLQVRTSNERVKKGQILAEIYSPELLTTQEEYLLLKQHGDVALVQAARDKLLLLGLTSAQLTQLDRTGKAMTRFSIASPINGIISTLNVRQGMQVSPGMTLFTLANLDEVSVRIEDTKESSSTLLIPTESIITTGTRQVVILRDNNKFFPVQVTLGQEAAGKTQVLSGLKVGDEVVISGQFLIDSESNLTTALQRLEDNPAADTEHFPKARDSHD